MAALATPPPVRRHGKWIILGDAGAGGFSIVKTAQDETTGELVALKFLKPEKLTDKKVVLKEIEHMSKVQHPNVLRLKEVVWDTIFVRRNGTRMKTHLIVLELASGGELFAILSTTGAFEERLARTYFHQLVDGLEAVHSAGIAHRDLKPENILIGTDFTLKIADFGLSRPFDADHLMFTGGGTSLYQPPEFGSKGYDGVKVDIWAAGVILFMMIAGFPPYSDKGPTDWWYDKIVTNRMSLFWQAHERQHTFSPESKDLLTGLLDANPVHRFSLSQVRAHPWFNGPMLRLEDIAPEMRRRQRDLESKRMSLPHPMDSGADTKRPASVIGRAELAPAEPSSAVLRAGTAGPAGAAGVGQAGMAASSTGMYSVGMTGAGGASVARQSDAQPMMLSNRSSLLEPEAFRGLSTASTRSDDSLPGASPSLTPVPSFGGARRSTAPHALFSHASSAASFHSASSSVGGGVPAPTHPMRAFSDEVPHEDRVPSMEKDDSVGGMRAKGSLGLRSEAPVGSGGSAVPCPAIQGPPGEKDEFFSEPCTAPAGLEPSTPGGARIAACYSTQCDPMACYTKFVSRMSASRVFQAIISFIRSRGALFQMDEKAFRFRAKVMTSKGNVGVCAQVFQMPQFVESLGPKIPALPAPAPTTPAPPAPGTSSTTSASSSTSAPSTPSWSSDSSLSSASRSPSPSTSTTTPTTGAGVAPSGGASSASSSASGSAPGPMSAAAGPPGGGGGEPWHIVEFRRRQGDLAGFLELYAEIRELFADARQPPALPSRPVLLPGAPAPAPTGHVYRAI